MEELIFSKEIASNSHPGKKYFVRLFKGDFDEDIWKCNCLGFLYRSGQECTHIQKAKRLYKTQTNSLQLKK